MRWGQQWQHLVQVAGLGQAQREAPKLCKVLMWSCQHQLLSPAAAEPPAEQYWLLWPLPDKPQFTKFTEEYPYGL